MPYDSQNVVGLLGDDSLGNFALATHRVQRDDAAFQVQDLDQLREYGDLVALRVHRPLPQDQPVASGEGADHVLGRLALVHGGPHRLANQGDDVPGPLLADGLDPGLEAFSESLGVQEKENQVGRVRARNAMRQVEERQEPGFLGLSEPVDVLLTVGAAHHGKDRDQDDVEQFVALALHLAGACRQRIGEKGVEKLLQITIEAGKATKTITEASFEKVIVDTTVQPKNVQHPTDAHLYRKVHAAMLRIAMEEGLVLRQSYRCMIDRAFRKHGSHSKARQFKRAKKVLKSPEDHGGPGDAGSRAEDVRPRL